MLKDLLYSNYIYIDTNRHSRWRLLRKRRSLLVCSRVVGHNLQPVQLHAVFPICLNFYVLFLSLLPRLLLLLLLLLRSLAHTGHGLFSGFIGYTMPAFLFCCCLGILALPCSTSASSPSHLRYPLILLSPPAVFQKLSSPSSFLYFFFFTLLVTFPHSPSTDLYFLCNTFSLPVSPTSPPPLSPSLSLSLWGMWASTALPAGWRRGQDSHW